MINKCCWVFGKIREYGVICSLQKVIHILCNYVARCQRMLKLLFFPGFNRKRILGIWDYKSLPWSIGDPLAFIEQLSIMKIKNKAEAIDICIIYDRDNPGGNRHGSNLLPENAQDYILESLPLFSTCPFLGSIFQFNSREEFYRFFRTHAVRYDIFPTLDQHLTEKYNYHGDCPHLKEIQEFYNDYGYIPYLRIGIRESSWAQWFYFKHLPENTVPVALTLRQTLGDSERNADQAVWLSFIDKCSIGFPDTVFVIAGIREEVFSGLRNRRNVILTKDYGTSIIEDMALIRTSFMYMGTTSGINQIATFSDLPYLIFQWPLYNANRLFALKAGERFTFATDKQKTFDVTIPVTTELLFSEFTELYSKLDQEKWFYTTLNNARNKYGHPSSKGAGQTSRV